MSLEDYRHPLAGFSLPVPTGWESVEDPQDGVALVVVEPPGAVAFRANAVVTVETVPDGYDLGAWQAGVDELLPRELPNYSLIDREFVDDGERRIVRRLGHYVGEPAGSVTLEQWAVIVGRVGYTLTTSIATFSYDSLADTFAEMASRFRAEGIEEVAP